MQTIAAPINDKMETSIADSTTHKSRFIVVCNKLPGTINLCILILNKCDNIYEQLYLAIVSTR